MPKRIACATCGKLCDPRGLFTHMTKIHGYVSPNRNKKKKYNNRKKLIVINEQLGEIVPIANSPIILPPLSGMVEKALVIIKVCELLEKLSPAKTMQILSVASQMVNQ